MSDSELQERSGDWRKEAEAFETRSRYVAEVFQELILLLEQYAPVWYTEEHHNGAMTALRVLNEARELGKTQAARSQKAP